MASQLNNIIRFPLNGRAEVEKLLQKQEFKALQNSVWFDEDHLSITLKFTYDGDSHLGLDDKISELQNIAAEKCSQIFSETDFSFSDVCIVEGKAVLMRSYDISYTSPSLEADVKRVLRTLLELKGL